MTHVYEHDLARAVRRSLESWQRRPLREKLAETLLLPIRSQL